MDKEKRKLARIKEAYAAGIDSIEEYKVNKEKISASIAEIEKKMHQETKVVFDVNAFADRVSSAMKEIAQPELSDEERNNILRTFIDRVVFERIGRDSSIQVFYYD